MSAQTTLAPNEVAPPSRSAASTLARRLAASPEAGVIIACVVVFLAIAANAETYTAVGNLQVMGRDLSQVGILAIGEALVILTGGIDLSVGALAGLAGILAGWMNVNEGLPAPSPSSSRWSSPPASVSGTASWSPASTCRPS